MGGEHNGRPITQRLAGTIACRALRDPWPPATPRALQPTTLHDRALTCPPCCKPTATSRQCAASLDESQPTRGPAAMQLPPCPALPCHMCLCACVPACLCVPPGAPISTTREPAPLGTSQKRKSRHWALEWLHGPHARPVSSPLHHSGINSRYILFCLSSERLRRLIIPASPCYLSITMRFGPSYLD